MARERQVGYRCGDCGEAVPKWTGWCPRCGANGSLVEGSGGATADVGADVAALGLEPGVPLPVAEVDDDDGIPRSTGVAELDWVLGGGLVPGSATLLAGEPGSGKSTLALQLLGRMAATGMPCLYVTAEESAAQLAGRARRLGVDAPRLWLVADTVLPHVLAHLDTVRPAVVVVDSVQTLVDPTLSSSPGSVAQVRQCAHRLVAEAKRRARSTVLVGHVTKDGAVAGPRVLEHMVDTVLSLEGERQHTLRLLRATKHRFGATSELGLFEMRHDGLVGVADPSALFLADRVPGLAGSVVGAVLDGRRPLLVEVQALVSRASGPASRRVGQGVDSGRLGMILAVLEHHVGLPLAHADVHVAVAGGVRVTEPGADLAIALAVASAATGRPVPAELVAAGEVGLGGELRQAPQTPSRLREAARLGFDVAVVPTSSGQVVAGLTTRRVGTLCEAVLFAGLAEPARDAVPEPMSA